MIKIFGSPQSSAGRCFWCLEEVGAAYEKMPMNMREKEHKSPAFLEINPNGKIPAIIDGNLKLWESMAINYYLAEKHKPELMGKTLEEKAMVHQWSFWSIAELQPPIINSFIQKVFVPEDKRDHNIIKMNEDKIGPMLTVLDNSLNTNYLAGSEFTLADLNTASVVGILRAIQYDISSYKNINAWLGKIHTRDGFKRYTAMMMQQN